MQNNDDLMLMAARKQGVQWVSVWCSS